MDLYCLVWKDMKTYTLLQVHSFTHAYIHSFTRAHVQSFVRAHLLVMSSYELFGLKTLDFTYPL